MPETLLERSIFVPYARLKYNDCAGQVRSLLSSAYGHHQAKGTEDNARLKGEELEFFALLVASYR
jgi:hypothetical protein